VPFLWGASFPEEFEHIEVSDQDVTHKEVAEDDISGAESNVYSAFSLFVGP